MTYSGDGEDDGVVQGRMKEKREHQTEGGEASSRRNKKNGGDERDVVVVGIVGDVVGVRSGVEKFRWDPVLHSSPTPP